jgi:hypothetical protein
MAPSVRYAFKPNDAQLVIGAALPIGLTSDPRIGDCLRANVDGRENTAVGAGAIESGDGGNTAVGFLAGNDITGSSNTCLGHSTGSNLIDSEGNIYIGAQVQPGATNELEFIRIGDDTAFGFPYDTFIAGIFDRDVDAGTFAFALVDDTGKLGDERRRRQREQGGCTYSQSYAQRLPQRAKESRGIGRYGCASRGNGQRAARANPKSERPG